MGISVWQLLIVLVIVLLLFGTKRLRTLGSDLGNAVRGFKGAMKDDSASDEDEKGPHKLAKDDATMVDGEVASKERDRI